MSKKATKKTLSMALAAALAFAPMQAFAASNDIAGHWAEKVITDWQNKGLISGYEDGTFKPNNSVTRAEFVIIMNNAMGFNKTGDVSFTDVQPGNWFYKAVATAVAQGYTKGYADGTFKPNATISRAEAAVMIANAAGLAQDEAGAKFSDDIPSWARGSVGAVVKAGYMSGYPDGTFGAYKSITRAEAVSSLNRVIGGKVDEGTKGEEVVVKEAGTKLEDQTVTGNLVVDEAVSTGDVTVKNSTIKGDLVVKGGGTIYLENVTVEGKIIVEKKDAKVQLGGKTSVSDVTVNAVCTLTASSDFDGKVGTVTIAKELGTDSSVVVKVPAGKINIDKKASVDVQKDAGTVTVAKDAAESKVYVASGVKVDKVVTNGKTGITGSGKVGELEVNVDGITVGSNLKVDKTVVADGVKKPTTSSGSSGSGGGSSSRPEKPGIKNVSIKAPTKVKPGSETTLEAVVTAVGNVDKTVKWEVTGNTNATGTKIDKDTGVLTVAADETGTLKVKATSNGDATKSATVDIKVVAAKAESIKLDKETATVSKGSEVTFKATVTDNYNEVMDKATVTWKLTVGEQEYTEGEATAEGVTITKNDAAQTLKVQVSDTFANAKDIAIEASVADVTTPAKATAKLTTETATVTSVKVTPDKVDVKKGAEQQFTAEVLDQNGAVVTGKTVEWTVEGNKGSKTNISDGKLTVAADETNTTLAVKATEATSQKVGTATVNVLEASKPAKINITSKHTEVAQGGTLDFTGEVVDQYGEKMDTEGITWEVTGATNTTETKFTDAKLAVAADEAAEKLTIIAKSKTADTVKAETTVTVTKVAKPVDVKQSVELKNTDKVLKVTLTEGTFDTTKTDIAMFTLTEKTVTRAAAITAKVTKVEFSADKKTAYLTIEVTGAATGTPMELTIKAAALETPAKAEKPECGAKFVEAGNLSKNTFTFKQGKNVTTDGQNIATITLTDGDAQTILANEVTLTADDLNGLNGLTAKAKATDASTITVTFEGTPTEAKTSTFTLTIPDTEVTKTGNVAKNFTQTITVNVEKAEVPPVTASAKATGTVTGKAGEAFTNQEITITLTDAKFVNIDKNADLKDWVKNSDVKGNFTVVAKEAVTEANNTTITLKVDGTITEAYDKAVDITIPQAKLQNATGELVATSDAKFAIAAKEDATKAEITSTVYEVAQGDAGTGTIAAKASGEAITTDTKVDAFLKNLVKTGDVKVFAAAEAGKVTNINTFKTTTNKQTTEKMAKGDVVAVLSKDGTSNVKKYNVTVTDSAPASTTIDKDNVVIKASSNTVKIELTSGKEFASKIEATQFEIKDATSKVNVKVDKAELDIKNKNVAYLTISGATDKVANATLKINKNAFKTPDSAAVSDISKVTAGVAVTAKATKVDGVAFDADLTSANKKSTVTVTGANVKTKDGIIVSAEQDGITATVGDPTGSDANIDIKIGGKATAIGEKKFTVTIPESALTVTEGNVVKGDVTVEVTVDVVKADVDVVEIHNLVAPANAGTPVTKEQLAIKDIGKYEVTEITWTEQKGGSGDFSALEGATFATGNAYKATIKVAPKENYQIKTTGFDKSKVTVKSDTSVNTTGTVDLVGSATANEVVFTVTFANLS